MDQPGRKFTIPDRRADCGTTKHHGSFPGPPRCVMISSVIPFWGRVMVAINEKSMPGSGASCCRTKPVVNHLYQGGINLYGCVDSSPVGNVDADGGRAYPGYQGRGPNCANLLEGALRAAGIPTGKVGLFIGWGPPTPNFLWNSLNNELDKGELPGETTTMVPAPPDWVWTGNPVQPFHTLGQRITVPFQ